MNLYAGFFARSGKVMQYLGYFCLELRNMVYISPEHLRLEGCISLQLRCYNPSNEESILKVLRSSRF